MLRRYNDRLANSIPWNLFLLTLGAFFMAWSINGVIAPHDFLSGGIMGVSLLLSYIWPGLPPLLLYGILCVPVYIAGWFIVGRRFLLYTIYGTLAITVMGFFVTFKIPLENEIYAAITGGVMNGAGCGIMLRSLGSSGGTDIIAILLKQRWNFPVGQFNFLFNVIVFLCGSFRLPFDLIISSILVVFISSSMLEYVVSLFNRRKLVFIISARGEEIAEAILVSEKYGVTLVRGKGVYSGGDLEILLTVTNNVALKRLETLVYMIDPRALFVVENTFYVSGGQFSAIIHNTQS